MSVIEGCCRVTLTLLNGNAPGGCTSLSSYEEYPHHHEGSEGKEVAGKKSNVNKFEAEAWLRHRPDSSSRLSRHELPSPIGTEPLV